MRFTSESADLPDQLLWAHDEGRVVFICGAGVSRAKARLPNFDELTYAVLNGLKADESEEAFRLYRAIHAAETAAEIKGVLSPDHIFQLLERSFTKANIDAQVAQALAPPRNVDLSAHRTLLTLSKNLSGAVRLVTTNFDRLFEQCGRKLPTVTRSNLPSLSVDRADWGVVHMHGCVNSEFTGPTDDGFVLSSASFGDAYLAVGWAREFVKAVLEKYVVVFVGYAADDPPIRYLLQGLQQSNKTSHTAYAFQSSSDAMAVAGWEDKGVETLLYETEHGCGHRNLWETLEHWATRAKDPKRWRSRVLTRARQGPKALAPHERGMVAHIVSDLDGAEAFAGKRPQLPAEWLCVFDPGIRYGKPNPYAGHGGDGPIIDPFDWYRLDSDPLPRTDEEWPNLSGRVPAQAWSALDPSPTDRQAMSQAQVSHIRGPASAVQPELPDRIERLARWIAKISKHPATAWWAGGQYAINDAVLDRIRDELEGTPKHAVRSAVRRAWQAYLDYTDLKPPRNQAWSLNRRIERTGWSEAVADAYAGCFAPCLRVHSFGRGPVPPRTTTKPKYCELVRVAVKYDDQILSVEVPDEYLQVVVPKVRARLEQAEALEEKYSSSTFICSIEPDDDAEGDASVGRTDRLSGRVLAFVGLFCRLAQLSPELAQAELRAWPAHSHAFARIQIWALGKPAFATADEFAHGLLALDDKRFWPFHGERDLLLGLSRHWSGIDRRLRRRLERRLCAGPPKPDGGEDGEHAPRAAGQVLSRLHWLHRQGCEFALDLNEMTTKLRATAPRWRPVHADHAADSRDGRVGSVRLDTDYSSIESLPPDQILEHLERQTRAPHKPFVRFDPFLGLSKERPELAIEALIGGYAKGYVGASHWHSFLRQEFRENDDPEFTLRILDALLNLSDRDFGEIAYPSASWFKQAASGCLFSNEPRCEALWSQFMRVLGHRGVPDPSEAVQRDVPAGRTRDWSTAAIASPAGNLAELVVKALPDDLPEARGTAAASWLPKLEELLKLPADSRRFTLATVAGHLDWFFAMDPEWTAKHVLSVLDKPPATEPDRDRDALWAGFFLSPTARAELFGHLKPHLLKLTRKGSDPDQRYSEPLAGILLLHWKHREAGDRLIDDDDMRTAIFNADDSFRHILLWTLGRWSDDSEAWNSDHIVEFLSEAWPRQKRVRTDKTSTGLVKLALSRSTGFREVAQIVTQLIARAHDARYAIIPALSELGEVTAGQYPHEVLNLLHAFLPIQRAYWPDDANDALQYLKNQHPSICRNPMFIELDGRT